jgi:hypothetical protein
MARNYIYSMFAHYVARSYNLEHDKNENLWFTYLQNQMKFYALKSDHWFWQHIKYKDKQLKPIVDYIENDVEWFCHQHAIPKDAIDYSKTKLTLHRFDRENYMTKFKDPDSFINVFYSVRALNNLNTRLVIHNSKPVHYPLKSDYAVLTNKNEFEMPPGTCVVHLNTEPQEVLKNPLHISTYMIMVRYYEKEKT